MKYLFLILFFVSSLYSYANEKNRLEKVSLQLHWKYQFEFAGFIAAKEKGFYEDVGLDVELKEYHYGTNIEKDVLNRVSNYGIYNSSTLISYLQGKPIKLVASFFKRAALVLITKPEIKTPKDLIGKKVMASTKEDFLLNFKPFLDYYGVSIEDLTLTPHTYSVDDFLKSDVDAMTAFISDQVYKLDKHDAKYNILDPSNDNLYVLQMELFTSQHEAEKHPSRAINFRNASIKGWQYALTHKDEMVEIIHKKYAPNISKEDLLKEAKGVEKLILPHTYDIGSIDRNFLNKQLEFCKVEYRLQSSKELDDFIFNYEYVQKSLFLDAKEKQYVKDHPVVSVCVHNDQFPIDGVREGKMTGIMSEIFNDISQTSSLSFKPIITYTSQQLQEKIKTKECQILSIYATKSDEFPQLQATQPLMNIHFTLISELDKSFILSAEELEDEIIVVQTSAYKEYLAKLYPYLHIIVQEDRNKMVEMVLHKKAYAIASLDFQADYLIDQYGYGKLKINGFLAKENPVATSIGVQKNDPLLYSIIDKGVRKISRDRIENILNSWRISRYQKVKDYSLVWKIGVFMGMILLVMIYYQRKLKEFNKELENQVARQTKKLREINSSLEQNIEQKAQELIKKDEILTAQSKQAVMGEMISMIAHQWRQPLNTITLQISNVQLKYLMNKNIDLEEINKTFETINTTIRYLSETVDDFKTYFNKNKKLVEVVFENAIHKALNLIRPRLKDIKIDLKIDQEVVAFVYFNELVQVLLNILNNAVDAYQECEYCEKKIIIKVEQQEFFNIISIEDNAGGIAPEHLDKLFEPYFSTKGKNGTGLGLYMSKMIIEKQFSGELQVWSGEGRTRFSIKLPKSCPV